MKIIIELEITSEEIPLATELFKSLRLLTDHVKTREIKKLFVAVISRLNDVTQLDSVSSEILTLLSDNHTSAMVYDELIDGFGDVIFSQEIVKHQQSVVPYMLLLPRLPEIVRKKLREKFIPLVLQQLTVKREVDATRMEFFSYAEAFAALANMEFIPLTGAISTIITMLRKPENRCAAVTMLGKTVELCLQQLKKCDASLLSDLRIVVQNVTEPHFQYDINYIEDSMCWKQQTQSSSFHDRVLSSHDSNKLHLESPVSGIYAVDSYHGHRSTVFAMSYDSKRSQLISGGKDGTLIVWSADGKILDTVEMSHHYACSMDIHSSAQSLLVCGVPKEDAPDQIGSRNVAPPSPCIFRFGALSTGWKEQAVLSKESSKLVSCIKAIGSVDLSFITGETYHTGLDTNSQRIDERVCYYDMHPAASFATLQPVRQYTEHEDLITCLSLFPPNQNIFMSASRDCTIRVWDRRTERCIGMFGSMGKNGRVQAHDGMITCLDAIDSNMIISASMDTRIHRWDFRTLANQGGAEPVSSLQLDDTAILKVALGGSTGSGAVSTLRGLYFTDFANPRPFARVAEGFSDGRRVGRYHDLKWSPARSLLFAAGDDMRIDVYAIASSGKDILRI